MPVKERVLFPYLAAAWASTLILVVTILAGNALGERGLPFRIGGGVIALLAGALVWFAVSEPLRLRRAVDEATEALKASEQRYKHLYEHAPLAYFTLSEEGTVARANKRASEVLGRPVDELQGKPLVELFADIPDGRPKAETILEDFLEGREIEADEVAMRKGDGEILWVQLTMRATGPADGDGEQSLSMVMDITERKRAEERLNHYAKELERSNQDLEQFAYVVSHDLQEPLRMVKSYVSLLERRYKEDLDQDAKEFIDFAVDGVERMEALIRDLLAYSRVGTRGGDLEPVAVGEVLEDALANLAMSIEEASATVKHDDLPEVRADPAQLRQLLQNLIGNAIKYRSEEPPVVEVAATPQGNRWEIAISDNGKGIPENHQERIFEIFQRGEAGRSEVSGTGIGLAICKRIVERHGGHITVDSAPGKGSTFRFTLPDASAELPDDATDGWSPPVEDTAPQT